MKSTLLHKQIRVAKFNKSLAKALVKHDLLLDDPAKRKQNRISEKSDMNVYIFKGQEIKTEEERKQALLYVESLYENDNENFDSTKFSKAKYKFKKWIDNEKTPEEEKELYRQLLKITDKRQHQSISIQKAIDKLLNTDKKITRLNDKKKAITTLIELHNQKIDMNVDSGSQLNSCVISTIFKIPDHNKTPLSGEEQQRVLNEYYKQNFPDYEIIYSVIHKDEIIDHAHNMINGKNQKTNEYDFVQKQYEHILNNIKLDGFPEKYSECSAKQIKLFGELIQQDFYDFINMQLDGTNVYFEKKKYDSEEEKALDRENIKNDTSKPIADRAYNTATYLEEQKNKNRNENKELIAENNLVKVSTKTLRKQIDGIIKSAFEAAAEYAVTAYEKALIKFGKEHKALEEISEFIAEKAKKDAIEMQPNEEQKEKIKEITKPPKA